MVNYKLISHGKEARQKFAKGSDKLAELVVSTLGPRSKNVIINQSYPAPKILHDGVSIAREVFLRDPFEDMGAQLIKEAASKTNDLAGDGTTTATLLANTLLQEGIKLVEGGVVDGVISGKINSMMLKEEILAYSDLIIDKLDKQKKELTTPEEKLSVAKISAGNPKIGEMVAEVLEKVGKDGVVMVEAGNEFEDRYALQEGMEFSNGYLSPYFVTDPDHMTVDYQDGYVLMTDYGIADAEQLSPIVTEVIKANKPLIIVADDVVGPALAALVLTKMKMKAKLVAVIAPEYADRRKEVLADMAVLTGGDVISQGLDMKISDVKIANLGRFKNLKVTENKTVIIPKNPDKEEIKERVDAIKKQIDQEPNEFKQEKLKERLGNLSSNVAVITVGGGSDSEIKEKKERFIDAVGATKAALSEGVIPGGGVALRDIAEELIGSAEKDGADTQILQLIVDVLCSPIQTILKNSGIEDPRTKSKKGFGINVITGKEVDMVKEGILDPVKVTKSAVKYAFSVAAMMITAAGGISDLYEEDNKKQTA